MYLNVLIIDFFHESVIKNLKAIPNLEINYSPNLSEDQILEKLNDVSILVLRTSYTVTPVWLNKAKSLKMIIVGGNGTNHIPVEELKTRNILLKNVKNALNGVVGLQNENWLKNELIGNELQNKQIGLIGFGEIGQAIADKLRSFGVSIFYYDPFVNHLEYKQGTIEEVLSQSDIISIQVPLNKNTNSLINADYLSLLKKKALVLNLSRYEVLNMDDLYNFLINNKKYPSFFIDPIEIEQIKEVQKFKNLPVTFLPHLGANTIETQLRVGVEIEAIIENFTNNFINLKENN